MTRSIAASVVLSMLLPAVALAEDRPGAIVAAAPAPRPVPVVASPPPAPGPPAAEAPARGVFVGVQVGAPVPLSGPLLAHRAVGAELTAAGGLWLMDGVAGFVEVVGAHHPTTAGWSYTTFAVGLGARGVLVPEMALHPFGEGGVLLQFVTHGTGRAPALDGATARIGLTMSVGLELDLSRALSLELGVRPEFVFASGTWPDGEEQNDNMFLLTPFAGATLYL